jgi:glycerol-3-phosphate dehydrogenase (NAD(P)+)
VSTIGVLGAGSWGTTLADLLARRGHQVRLWAYEPEVVSSVNSAHDNPLFLPGCALAPSLRATEDPVVAVRGAEFIVVVAPSHVLRGVMERASAGVAPASIVVSATKGIEAGTLCLMSEVIAATLPANPVAALSGPSFALEVHQGQPTAVVAAAADLRIAQQVQAAFATSRFRVYTTLDVIGVQLGGALKNVIAIAAGVLDGLGLGNNPRAALITRGLAEIARLGRALGADPLTFSGLAGMGDLILTSTGALSRNRALGIALAQGRSYEHYTAAHRSVAEGASTARAALSLAARYGVELPICEQVAGILFEGRPAQQAVAELMDRTPKAEQWR